MFRNDLDTFIRAHGFIFVPEESEPNLSMDSETRVFVSQGIGLRIVRDRGQHFVDFRSQTGGPWLDIFELMKKVNPNFSPATGSFSEACSTIEQYWPRLSEFLERKSAANT